MNQIIRVTKEVEDAVKNNKPVVALESTIISHGMPYPQNVETARNVESIIRDEGAVPATVFISNGQIIVGASREEIEFLGKEGEAIPKASRRDLAVLLSKKQSGATTVTTTMIGAHMAGVKVFATGGIGGVHRGAEKTMDISADLEELAQTNVLVVCAGAKSILDIGLTLEYLETKGVPVIGYGTDEVPAFFTRSSGFKADYRLDTPQEVAAAFAAKERAGLKGAMLLTNPIPEEYSMDPELINGGIEAAVKECENLGIKGKAITPYLLKRINELTKGKSLSSNIQLVYNNARVAAKIAKSYCEQQVSVRE